MTTFRVQQHTHGAGQVVEVFVGDRFVAAIYGEPGELKKIVSK